MALVAASLCLLISLALIALAGTSSNHLLAEQQADHGNALASQIARRVSNALESGDLLSVSASLQRFVETSSADQVQIFDVEGQAPSTRPPTATRPSSLSPSTVPAGGASTKVPATSPPTIIRASSQCNVTRTG